MPKTDWDLAKDHKYRVMDGEIGINVTAVTGQLDHGGKSSRMAAAAAKITREGRDYRKEWNDKMHRGTRGHDLCEELLLGGEPEALPEDQPILDALRAFLQETQPEPLELERVVISHLGYGGRFDMIVRFPSDDVWLIDLKTGRPYPTEHCCQLAAYRYADGMALYDDKGKLTGIEALPHIDAAGCLYLKEDGTYNLVEYPVEETAFEIFWHLLDVYKSVRSLEKEITA